MRAIAAVLLLGLAAGAPAVAQGAPESDNDNIADLTRRMRRWRESTIFTGALAAGLPERATDFLVSNQNSGCEVPFWFTRASD